MPVIAGGWTADATAVDFLDQSGNLYMVFFGMVKGAVKTILATKELTGALTNPEKALRDGGDEATNRVIDFIKIDGSGKFAARGYYMPGGDIAACINSQWANILKKYS